MNMAVIGRATISHARPQLMNGIMRHRSNSVFLFLFFYGAGHFNSGLTQEETGGSVLPSACNLVTSLML